MASVLVIDHDALFQDSARAALSHHNVLCASDAVAGLRIVRDAQPLFVLVSLALRDVGGLQVIRRIHATCGRTVIIATTDADDYRGIVLSLKSGADDCLVKPVAFDQVSSAIDSVSLELFTLIGEHAGTPVIYAATRWAGAVAPLVRCNSDPKTLATWARWVAASAGALRSWCRAADISSRRSLLFARVLRAVTLRQEQNVAPEETLDVIDRRSMLKLLRLGDDSGLTRARDFPRTVEEYLLVQKWVTNGTALRELRIALERQPAPFIKDNGSQLRDLGFSAAVR